MSAVQTPRAETLIQTLGQGGYQQLTSSLAAMLVPADRRGEAIDVEAGLRMAIGYTLEYGYMPNDHIRGIVERADNGTLTLSVFPGVNAYRHSLEVYNRENHTHITVEQQEISRGQVADVFRDRFPDTPPHKDDRACRSRLINLAEMTTMDARRSTRIAQLEDAANLLTQIGGSESELAELRREILGVATEQYDPPWIYTRWARNAHVVETDRAGGKTIYGPDDVPTGRTAQWVANNRGFKAAVMDRIPLKPVDDLSPEVRLRRLAQYVSAETVPEFTERESDNAPLITTDGAQREANGDMLFAATEPVPAERRTETGVYVAGTGSLSKLGNDVNFYSG